MKKAVVLILVLCLAAAICVYAVAEKVISAENPLTTAELDIRHQYPADQRWLERVV